jgi:hypothetical protein
MLGRIAGTGAGASISLLACDARACEALSGSGGVAVGLALVVVAAGGTAAAGSARACSSASLQRGKSSGARFHSNDFEKNFTPL